MRYLGSILALLIAASLAAPVHAASKKSVPYGVPVEFRIPRLGIRAKVEKTTVDKKGVLTAPKNPKQVGWYRNGTIPGKRGNAVILGHVDWYNGPAVFYRLNSIRRGDIVEVLNDYGAVLKFRVTEKSVYVNGSVPLKRIVGPTKGFRLNIFTCTGVYSRSAKNYSHRTVVYSTLVR